MRYRLWLILSIGLLGVSFGAPLARFLPDMPAFAIAFWRVAIAGALLWAGALIKPRKQVKRVPQRLVIPAGFLLACHFASFYAALKFASVANVTLLVTLAPVFMLLIEVVYMRRPFSLPIILGLAVALAGSVVVQGLRFDPGSEHTLGNLISLGSALCWAGVLIIAERIRRTTGTIAYTRWLYPWAAGFLLIIAVLSGVSVAFTTGDLIWLLALGIIPTLIGHSSLNYAIKFLRPTVVGSIPLGEPVLATILAWLFFGESVSMRVLIGGAVVLSGLLVIALGRGRSARSGEPSDLTF